MCPVPQLEAMRVAPFTAMPAGETCTWQGRFVHYIDASSVRAYTNELGRATYVDDRYYSLAAFDCDPSTAWVSAPLRDTPVECSAAHARGGTVVALPIWIALPSARARMGRSSGRRVLRSFSVRAVDFATGAAVTPPVLRSTSACDSVSPRAWRLEAKLAGSAVSSWANAPHNSASVGSQVSADEWFAVAEGTELRAWACSELRHFAVSDTRGIDLNTHALRLMVLSVGSTAPSTAASLCDESLAALAEIDVAFDTVADDDSDL